MKKDSNALFYIVCVICACFIMFLLLNVWFMMIPEITLDKYSVLLIFAFIGLCLLPFMSKIKIANFLELEKKLANGIKDVKATQYLGEVIKSSEGDLFFCDSDGKHIIPDIETATFLRSSKGEISVAQDELDSMKTSFPIDSVLTSRIVLWKNSHFFVILNGKKFHIGSGSFLAEWNKAGPYETIDDEEMKLFPRGK